MRKIVLVFILLLFAGSANSAMYPEKWYQNHFCKARNGKAEVVLSDRTRADCLTATHAFEVDFAHKWAEAVGQSLHYAEMTGKRPGIVLIVEKIGDVKYIERVVNAINRVEGGVKLIIVYPDMYAR